MNMSIAELTQKVSAQAARIPSMYGRVDFSITPERFTANSADKTHLDPELLERRPELLANKEQVARIKAYTMHGDPVADAYAALIPKHGFRQLVMMLHDACDHSPEEVPSAPSELIQFIREMERFPEWLDKNMVEQGARIQRNAYVHKVPFVIRGGLIATFLNKYTALPMAMTGALSSAKATHRVNETATFFTSTVMPGGLDRHGVGFKSAAMVRLMHSMVRFNLLSQGDRWDCKTYGIPIPQVDQMPVGFFSIFPLAKKMLREGRTAFTPAERARVEHARYMCFLLGLPEDLLADTPQGIVDILLTRHATLRQEFDDTCSALIQATMTADLSSGRSMSARLHAWLERRFARVFFVTSFMRGDKIAAAKIGVEVSWTDYLVAAATGILITVRMLPYSIAARIPTISDAADRSLVRKLTKQLARYGHAEFTTNAAAYASRRQTK